MSLVSRSPGGPPSILTRARIKEITAERDWGVTWEEIEQKDTPHLGLPKEVGDIVFKCMDNLAAVAYAEAFPFPGIACRIIDAKAEDLRWLENVQAFFGKALGIAFETHPRLTLINGRFSVDLGVFEVSVKRARLDNLITIARTLTAMDEKGIEELEAKIQREPDRNKIKQYETELAIAKFFSQHKDITGPEFSDEEERSLAIGRRVEIWADDTSLADVPFICKIAATIPDERILSLTISIIVDFMVKQKEACLGDIPLMREIAAIIPDEKIRSEAIEKIFSFMREQTEEVSLEDVPLMREIAATIPDVEVRSSVIGSIVEFMLKQKKEVSLEDVLLILEIAATIPDEKIQSNMICKIVHIYVRYGKISLEDVPFLHKISATILDEEMRSFAIHRILRFMREHKDASLDDVPRMREIALAVDSEYMRSSFNRQTDRFARKCANQA